MLFLIGQQACGAEFRTKVLGNIRNHMKVVGWLVVLGLTAL